MLDVILIGLASVVRNTEDLITQAHWAVASGRLDEIEGDKVYLETQKMTDVLLVLDERLRGLARALAARPEMARQFCVHATLQ